jgi:ATP/maltotriose-dependent transcriptional regulator MalT
VASRQRLRRAFYDDPVLGDGDVDREALLARAQEAIAAGQWSIARDAFEAALEPDESGAALFGLGIALWWLGETEASLRHWERAYAVSRKRSEPEQAVLAAFYLCLAYRMSLGNDAASRGWLGRASSVVEEFDLGAMAGWVLVARAYVATDAGHPQSGVTYARQARELARKAGDADLELCSLSELGAALVELGQVEEGSALLDEAMAGALAGEGGDLDGVVLVSCRTITSCSRCGDLARATQWVRAADEFYQRYGSPHLYTTCRTHFGGILFATGKWQQAEQELHAALKLGERAEPALHAEALAKLAELRLAQGRIEEAARLVAGYEDHPAAAYAVAALHLVRGEPAVASSVLRRRLQEVEEGSLQGAALVELLTEVEIALGAADEAATRAKRLARLGSSAGSDLIVARGERALGRALVATGEPTGAISHLERALAAFGRLVMPLDAGRTRLLLAHALAQGEQATAIAEARGALECFEDLGAARDADAAAGFLRALGVKAARTGPRGVDVLTRREREVLGLLGEGLSNPEIAERLFISRKTVEHHVASVLAKLALRGRAEAAVYALRNLAADRISGTK